MVCREGLCQIRNVHTFDYELNVHNIKQALERCDLFVAFLSANSLHSSFIDEEQRLALEARGRGFLKRIVIISIDDTSYRQLPKWMQDINVIQKFSSPIACSRRLQSILGALQAEEDRSFELYIGRDDDEIVFRRVLSQPANSTPIFVHAVGYHGIGRRTFIKQSIRKYLPRICDVFIEITIQNFDSVENLYRKVYDLHVVSSLHEALTEFETFSKLAIREQCKLISSMIEEMASQNEFLLFLDDGGVYDDEGDYQEYLSVLLQDLSHLGRPIVGIVQTRMMPLPFRLEYKRSFHHYVKALSPEATRELLSLSLKAKSVDFSKKDIEDITMHLDGHPFNVRFATSFIESYGIHSIAADPSGIIEWKNRRAEEFLGQIEFNEIDSDIMAALSEYELLSSDSIFAALPAKQEDVAGRLRVLEEFCCIERREGYFHISSPIRGAVRRDKRFDKTDAWKQGVAASICESLNDYQDSDSMQISILESATLAAARGAKAPLFLARLILPSHLLRIAREYYDHDKRRLCMDFCSRAFEMRDRLTDGAKLEVLRLWGLSSVRLSDEEAYDKVMSYLGSIASPTAKRLIHFLKGFRHRLAGRLDDAEESFLDAHKLSSKNLSINRELASLYCKQKRYTDAEVFARVAYNSQPTNPYILDIMAETLLGKVESNLQVDKAEVARVLNELKIYGDAPGLSFYLIRLAQRLRRERDLPSALTAVNRAISRTSGLITPYFMRADIYISMNNIQGAEADLQKIGELLKSAGGFSREDESQLHDLRVRILIEKKQFAAAKDMIDKSAFLTRKAQVRLYKTLRDAVVYSPEEATKELINWAKRPEPKKQVQFNNKTTKGS